MDAVVLEDGSSVGGEVGTTSEERRDAIDEGLEDLATRALHRALRPEDNEWWELWDEASATDDITERLSRYLETLGD